jgi:helicase
LLDFLEKTGDALGQALVFVHSRRRAEKIAVELGHSGFPSAHHHAGLAHGDRRNVERKFRSGETRILVCTPTLEMGVNLPARYVFLYDLQRFDGDGFAPLSVNQVWQRGGRAGRPGMDDEGHVILIAPSWDRSHTKYEHSKFDAICSQLHHPNSLAEQIVAEVGSGLSRTRKQLARALATSLAAHQRRLPDFESVLDEMIDVNMVTEEPLASAKTHALALKTTPLGRVAVRHLLGPSSVLIFSRALNQPLSLSFFDLLLIISSCDDQEPKIRVNFEDLDQLGEHCRRLSSPLLRAGNLKLEAALGISGNRLLTAINTAYVLYCWTRIGDTEQISEMTGCYPSEVNRLCDSADRLLGALLNVYRVLRPKDNEEPDQPIPDVLTVDEKISALRFMVRSGLPGSAASMSAISGLGPTIAKRLYAAGFEDIDDLAAADPADLRNVQGISRARAENWISVAEDLIKTRPAYLFDEDSGFTPIGRTEGNKNDRYRARRALSLSVQVNSDNSFRVTGGTDPHLIKQAGEVRHCDCADFSNGNYCKHLIAVDMLQARTSGRVGSKADAPNTNDSLDLYALWDTNANRELKEPRAAA